MADGATLTVDDSGCSNKEDKAVKWTCETAVDKDSGSAGAGGIGATVAADLNLNLEAEVGLLPAAAADGDDGWLMRDDKEALPDAISVAEVDRFPSFWTAPEPALAAAVWPDDDGRLLEGDVCSGSS